jgi:hypothetical protein
MSDTNRRPAAAPRDVVVKVSASVLNDLEAFKVVQAGVLQQVGHPHCTSGFNFIWQAYSEFAVDPDGRVKALANPEPSPWIVADVG